jgi:hypothetical protein
MSSFAARVVNEGDASDRLSPVDQKAVRHRRLLSEREGAIRPDVREPETPARD